MKVIRTLSHRVHKPAVKSLMDKLNILKKTCDQKSKHHSICLAMIVYRIAGPHTITFAHEDWECDQKKVFKQQNF